MEDGGNWFALGSLGNGVKEMTAAGTGEMKYLQNCPLFFSAFWKGNLNTIMQEGSHDSLFDGLALYIYKYKSLI